MSQLSRNPSTKLSEVVCNDKGDSGPPTFIAYQTNDGDWKKLYDTPFGFRCDQIIGDASYDSCARFEGYRQQDDLNVATMSAHSLERKRVSRITLREDGYVMMPPATNSSEVKLEEELTLAVGSNDIRLSVNAGASTKAFFGDGSSSEPILDHLLTRGEKDWIISLESIIEPGTAVITSANSYISFDGTSTDSGDGIGDGAGGFHVKQSEKYRDTDDTYHYFYFNVVITATTAGTVNATSYFSAERIRNLIPV